LFIVSELPAHCTPPVTFTAMTTLDRPFGRYYEDFQIGDIYKN